MIALHRFIFLGCLALACWSGHAKAAGTAPTVPETPQGAPKEERPALTGAEPPLTPEETEAVQRLGRWLEDPVAFYVDHWGDEPLDAWQADALRACARAPRVAMKACKGPGKTRVLAAFGWWALALHPEANGFALSITGANLRANLWKELGLLYSRPRAAWLRAQFEVSGDRVYHREHQLTWWLHARTFPSDADSTQQANTLAGLHARFVFVLADESSDYPDGVLAAADAIFATQQSEAHLVQAGNCTRSAGSLFRACTRERDRWVVIEITGDPDDPKRSPRISLEWARDLIARYGRSDPWVQANVLGVFPDTPSDKLLGPNDVAAAEARDCTARDAEGEAIIWGLDVARFGADKSHLRRRVGPVLFRGHDFRGMDGPTLAAAVSRMLHTQAAEDGRRPDLLCVDTTGVGASAVDHLRILGWGDVLLAVDFGGRAEDPARYGDRRAEMWCRAAEWTKGRGCWPSNSGELGRDMCAPSYDFRVVGRRTVKVLESKDDMKARGLPSPDEGDAFALTFAVANVVARPRQAALDGARKQGTPDWEPGGRA